MASKPSRDALMDHVREVFRAVLTPPPEALDERSAMGKLPGWDSLTHVALMTALERRFGVKLSLSELRRLNSVREILAALRSKGA